MEFYGFLFPLYGNRGNETGKKSAQLLVSTEYWMASNFATSVCVWVCVSVEGRCACEACATKDTINKILDKVSRPNKRLRPNLCETLFRIDFSALFTLGIAHFIWMQKLYTRMVAGVASTREYMRAPLHTKSFAICAASPMDGDKWWHRSRIWRNNFIRVKIEFEFIRWWSMEWVEVSVGWPQIAGRFIDGV